MVDRTPGRFVVISIIVIYFINVRSSQSSSRVQLVVNCSKWNQSRSEWIFGQKNGSAGNDANSLNLADSSLGINSETGAIAILDDNNARILVINRSNSSTLFAILFDSSNSTNLSLTHLPPSTIAYNQNNSIYILDGSSKQIMKTNSILEFGNNATSIMTWNSSGALLSNFSVGGLAIDNTDESLFITDYNNSRILRYEQKNQTLEVYINNIVSKPTSIVIDNNRTLYVNDVGNNRIQMFKFNSKNGTTLSTNINGCVGLSLYSPDILVINTNTTVYLYNLTDNVTTCAIGCSNSTLNAVHHALIDNYGSIIVTELNTVWRYPLDQQCSQVPPNFNPINNCSNRTFGINCSFAENICDVSRPCVNAAHCHENITIDRGYDCQCLDGYNGTHCQLDHRPCQPFACFGQGNCTNQSSRVFTCQCYHGYEGEQCEKTVNFCGKNATCQNGGICFQRFLNFTCQCLMGFHGRYCETIETSTLVRGYVSKSFGYVAILMLATLIGFIVIMDVMKYIFGIDPVRSQRNTFRRKHMNKFPKKKKSTGPQVIQRFQYIN